MTELDWYHGTPDGTFDGCHLSTATAFDPRSGQFSMLIVDASEGGPEAFRLVRAGRADDPERVLQGPVEPETVEELHRRVRDAGPLMALPSLRDEASWSAFSLNRYAPLVTLAAPLRGWTVYIESARDLDRPEHVLWLVARDGSVAHALDRRPAPLGPCDAEGHWCRRTQAECGAEGLRSEGRLCVLPLGIDAVYVSPSGHLLAVTGTVQVAGHGGYPGFGWVAALPDRFARLGDAPAGR
jgi:hypothetical protein